MITKDMFNKIENFIKERKEVTIEELNKNFHPYPLMETLQKLKKQNKIKEDFIETKSKKRNRTYNKKIIIWIEI